MISVVSAEIRNTLVARGVDPAKILVNPNGADLDAYAPAPPDEARIDQGELGLRRGGPRHRFHRHVRRLARHRRAGRGDPAGSAARSEREVPADRRRQLQAPGRRGGRASRPRGPRAQRRPRAAGRGRAAAQGVRHLRVAAQQPHGRQQVLRIADQDLRVHGAWAAASSPAISSRSAQVLSPALTRRGLRRPERRVADERAVLCTPGDVDEFVEAVVALVEHPDMARRSGTQRPAGGSATLFVDAARRQRLAVRCGRDVLVGDRADLRRKPKLRTARAPTRTRPPPAPSSSNVRASCRPATRTRTKCSTSGTTIRPARTTSKEAPAHTLEWFLEAEAISLRRVRAVDARDDGVRPPRRRGGARDRRRHGHRPRAVRAPRRARHRSRSVVGPPRAGQGELRAARSAGPVHSAGRRDAAVSTTTRFDVVYSNGVLHHTPNTQHVVSEILRVLKPGGKAIVMMYAEELAALLAQPGVEHRRQGRAAAEATRWARSCRARSSGPTTPPRSRS